MIRSSSGDLLTDNSEVLVNTINCVGVMGKGLALQFKNAYPRMFTRYKIACGRGEVKLGNIWDWQTNNLVARKFIFNFPTKYHWRNNSRLEDIDSGLEDLVAKINAYKVTSIAIPPLGCGNGGLDYWNDVRPRIISALEAVPHVRAVLYEIT